MEEIGELFGFLIIVLYLLTISKYILRNIDLKYKEELSISKYYDKFVMLKKLSTKYHRILGASTILVLIIHFIIQFSNKGISITGSLAALILISQVVLGIYMLMHKTKMKSLLKPHKIISIIILIAVVIHII